MPDTPTEATPAADPLAALTSAIAALQAMVASLAPPPAAEEPAGEAPPAEEPPAGDDALDQMQARHRREMDQFQRATDAKASALEAQVRVLEQYNLRIERKADLAGLQAQGFAFDLDEELAEVMGKTPEQYAKHLGKIPKVYRQSAVDQGMIDTGASPRPARKDETAITRDDFPKIAKIMEQKSLPYAQALEQYRQDRQAERA